jgi:Sec-independent protein translocase protein TatA
MFDFLHNIGAPEVIIIAVLVFLFFGGSKLGEFAKGIKESKKEINKIKEELQNPDDKKEEK